MTKTSHSQPMQQERASIQPWLRDRYAALRTQAGPRWQHTRAVVVPVLADTSHRVRDELVPAAMQLSSRVTEEAMHRSAPLRSEVSDRASATLAAARGQVSAAQIERMKTKAKAKRQDRSHRKFWFIGGAAALGAALGTAAVIWQRSRYQAWVDDEAVQNTISDSAEPERLDKNNKNKMGHDDPSDPDAGTDAGASSNDEHAPFGGRHGSRHR